MFSTGKLNPSLKARKTAIISRGEMSLSKSSQNTGQVEKPCEVCEVSYQIQWKCFDCKRYMCSACKETIHPKFKHADKHKIIKTKDITSEDLEEKPDLTSINCTVHDDKFCFLYCKDCEEAICLLCVTKTHTTHNMIELSEGYNLCIEKNKSYLEMINKTFDIDLSKLKTIELSEITRYQDGKKKIMMQESDLINLIHRQSQILNNEFEKHWNIFQDVISKEETILEQNVEQTKTRRKIFDDAASSSDANEAFRAAREGKQKINEDSERSYSDIQRPPTFVPRLVSPTTIPLVHGLLEFQDRYRRQNVVVIEIRTNNIRAALCLKCDYDAFTRNSKCDLGIRSVTYTNADRTSIDVVLKPNGKVHGIDLKNKLEFEEKRSDIFNNWYYFQNIGEILLEMKDELTTDIWLIESRNDVGGTSKKMKALDVYTAVMSYIIENISKFMSRRKENYMDDIFLVLTVPRICGTQGEQFMHDAAKKANFLNEQITITSEPDALAVYCEYMYGKLQLKGRGTHQYKGCKYLMFDEGDGTTDITVHEVTWPRFVKEIYRGTRWQRNSLIVEEFCSFLNQLFGYDVIGILKENMEYIEFVRRLELKIETFSQNSTKIVSVWIPVVHLIPFTTEPFEELVQKSSYNKKVGLLNDKLRITASLFRSFFENGMRYASEVLDTFIPAINKEITRVFAVHDCSVSPILTDVIKQKLGPTVEVIILKSNNAVLEGACVYGFQ